MGVIERTDRTIDLSGIDDHTVANLPLVTAGAVVDTDRGPILLVVHQAADMHDQLIQDHTISSSTGTLRM